MKTQLLFYVSILLINLSFAIEINVPQDYTTIQEAIDAANNGDIIIVDNGIYYENITFNGLEITVASKFYNSGDVNDIYNTVINGSQPNDSDFGSCVTFNNSENENSILMGFTITEGSGTRTYNAEEDLYFRTGGGILIDYASPQILSNIITNNECTAEDDVFGAGGGGIRMGFGNPTIQNNIIKDNLGGYAGGIMIAYCGGTILKNNVIANNTATGSFNGGGGVYVDWEPITLENNTIVNNHSGDRGGGIISTGTMTTVKNCIIYGNTATIAFDQIFRRYGGNATLTYTNFEGTWQGPGDEVGVINETPLFENTENYRLAPNSLCIDAGNPDEIYNDKENPASPGEALYPSLGSITNDMGAYGGQDVATVLSLFENEFIETITFKFENPYNNKGITITSNRNTTINIVAYSFDGKKLIENKSITLEKEKTVTPLTINTSCILVVKNNLNELIKTYKLLKK